MKPILFATMHRQGGVFTAEQAELAGISRDDLRSLIRRREVVRVRRNVYTTAALWDGDPVVRHRVEVAAALLNRGWTGQDLPRLVAGHRSAAYLWGFELPWGVVGLGNGAPSKLTVAGAGGERPGPPGVDLVSADRCKRTYRAGVSVRPAQLPHDQIANHGGVPLTSRARTAVDLMRESSRVNAMVIGDQALRLGSNHAELTAIAEHCAAWRGGKQALELATFSDGRAQSAAESVARHLVRERGLGPCVPQHEIRDSRGRKRLLDLAFVEQWTALEPDGKVKYNQPYGNPADVLWEEKLREDAVREMGWEVVRATWHQLLQEPDQVIARLRAAFARAALRHAS